MTEPVEQTPELEASPNTPYEVARDEAPAPTREPGVGGRGDPGP